MATRRRQILAAFNAGELSPLIDGRVDQDKYFTGGKTVQNFLPTVQGPLRRRGGTRHVGLTKDQNRRAWLLDFVFSAGQAYILEFGHLYVRFWTQRGQLLNLGVPYEIVSPYTEDDLITTEGTLALRTLQSGDTMWITHIEGAHPPYVLRRLGATNWTLTQKKPDGGPFRPINQDAALEVSASAATGSVTVTLTGTATSTFLAGHVGALFYMETQNPSQIAPFQTNVAYVAGDRIRNSGNVYECTTGGGPSISTTIRYAPTHTEGIADDGMVEWEYLHSHYGHGEITAVAGDGLSCTMTVIDRLPNEVVGGGANKTRRWAFGDICSVYGWPNEVQFFKERLVYLRNDLTIFASSPGDFNNFAAKEAGLVTKDTAMRLVLAADKVDDIRWASPARGLLIGSARVELSLSEQTAQQVFAADNVQSTPQTDYGSRLLRPLRVQDDILFVEGAGHRIRAAKYTFETDRYKAEDLTVLSEHLFDGSEVPDDPEREERDIVDWWYQQQRDGIIWCALSDGALAALVLNRERGVVNLTPHYIGGPRSTNGFVKAIVECGRSIPSPDARRTDDSWMIVRRTINGAVQRSVEYMSDWRLAKQGVEEGVFPDGSITYRGAATATITGLGSMEGEVVDICADGANHATRTVSGGQITLEYPAELVHVGFNSPARFQSMRLEEQSGEGTAQTARKGDAEVFLRMQNTVGGKAGPTFEKMDRIATLAPGAVVGSPPVVINGDHRMNIPSANEWDGYICYEQDLPLPATLVAVIRRVRIND